MPHVLFMIVCLIWGSSFILMKKAALAFGPIGVGAGRVVGGSLIIFLAWRIGGRLWPARRRHLPGLIFVALVGNVLPFTLQPYLIAKYDASAFFGMMVALVPLATIAASAPMLGVWPTWRQMVGVTGGLICFLIVFYDGHQRNIAWWDMALALLVPASYAMSNTFLKRHLADLPAMVLACAAQGLAAVVLLPVATATETVNTAEGFAIALGCIALLGVGSSGLAVVLFYRLVQQHGPLFAGMVTYIIPVIALAWGRGDNERMTWVQMIALVGIFAMVALVQSGTGKRGGVQGESG